MRWPDGGGPANGKFSVIRKEVLILHHRCNNCLRTHPTIRSLLAGVLLALFALGSTPKLFVHNLVTAHRDQPALLVHPGDVQLNAAGFHCHTESQVVEVPCISFSLSFRLEPPVVFLRRTTAGPGGQGHCRTPLAFLLRGPPMAV